MAISQTNATEKLIQQIDALSTAIANRVDWRTGSMDEAQDLISQLLEETRVSLEELRVAEEELREQNEELITSRITIERERKHYYDLFSMAPVGYLLTDKEGVIRESNDAAAKLLNVPLNYLIGKPLAIFIPNERRSAFRKWLLESDREDHVRVQETTLQARHSTELRDVSLTVTRLANNLDDSHVTSLQWLLYDITERKKAESAEREQYFYDTFEHSPVGIAHIDWNNHYLRVNAKTCDLFGYSRDELLQLTLLDMIEPDDLDYAQKELDKLLHKEVDSVTLEQRYRHKDGKIIWMQLTASGIYDKNGEYAYTITVLNDITESKRLMAAELEQRTLTEAVRKNAVVLTRTLIFEEVLDYIVETIGLIVPYDGASILLIGENPLDIHIERVWGDLEEVTPEFEAYLRSLELPLPQSNLFEYLAETKTPVILSRADDTLQLGAGSFIKPIQSLIIVPIILNDEIMGYFELHSSSSKRFTNQHSEHLQIFATQAAVAIQNARAYQQAQTLAAVEERQRLARDLHDAVSQTLFSSSILSEALLHSTKDKPDLIRQHLETLHMLNRGAMAEMRNLLMELRPDYLLKTPLAMQMQQLVDAVKSRKRINIQLAISQEKDLVIDASVQVVIYRITQEALNNIVKYASASEVQIELDNRTDQFTLSITDNGVGFDFEGKNNSTGMGLSNMQERANSIGAELDIRSSIGQGTQIKLRWLKRTELQDV